ncbi:MAG: ester cyclase [Polyangiales bacterium]
MTQSETNKALIETLMARMNAHDVEGACALAAEGLVNHAAIPEAQGRAGLERIARKVLEAFPDVKYDVKDLLADGDRVVCRAKMSGTHEGDLQFKNMPLAATGRRVEAEQIAIYRISEGRVVEYWSLRDDIAFMRQLGVLAGAS